MKVDPTALLLVVVLTLLGGCGPTFRASTDSDPGSIEIEREVHRFRHWQWSGIFPIEGGWIPDPHFMATDVVEVSGDLARRMGVVSARIQGFDINPWFQDGSTEIIVAIETNGDVYEQSLTESAKTSLGYGFVNGGPIVPFLMKDQLILFTALHITRPVFIVVQLPIQGNSNVPVYYEDTKGWNRIVAFLSKNHRYRELRSVLCSGKKRSFRYVYSSFEPCQSWR